MSFDPKAVRRDIGAHYQRLLRSGPGWDDYVRAAVKELAGTSSAMRREFASFPELVAGEIELRQQSNPRSENP